MGVYCAYLISKLCENIKEKRRGMLRKNCSCQSRL